jgi:hypothetical protein
MELALGSFSRILEIRQTKVGIENKNPSIQLDNAFDG